MGWQLTPYLPALFCAVFVASVTALYAFLRVSLDRVTPSFAAVVAFLLGCAEWALAAGYQLSNTGAEKVLWFRLSSLGVTVVVLSWFAFAAAATDRDEWLSARRFGPLVGVGVVAVALHLTNPLHRWLWAQPAIVDNGAFLVAQFEFRPLYFVLVGVGGVVTVGGLWLLVREARADDAMSRPLTGVLGVTVCAALAAGGAYYARVGSLVDLTPLAATATGVVLAYAVFRDRYFNAVPVSRSVVFRVMNEGMLVLDRREHVEDSNRAARNLLGVDEQVLDDDVRTVVPDAAEQFDAHGEDAEFTWTAEVTVTGEQRHLRMHVSPLSGDRHEGRVVLVTDISEQHRIEQRYQSLFEEVSDIITVIDASGVVTYVSPSVERVLGIPPETYVGESAFAFLEADERAEKEAEFERVLDDPEYAPRLEYELPTAAGETRIFEADVHNMFDNPHVNGVALVARDITERKKRERQLERANDRLSEFASILSHDLRNPLEVAQIHTTLAKRGDEDAFETVQQAHRRIDEMIDDILTLTRDGLEVDELSRVPVDDVAAEAWRNVRTGDATLTVRDDVTVRADRNRLLQVLENLFRNAVEHGSTSPDSQTPQDADKDGSPDVAVTVGTTDDGLFVEDDGDGFAAEDPASVFEHGYSTSTEGTGLGLTIVERIADAHGWSVTATHGADGGARFELEGMDPARRDAHRAEPEDATGGE